jgi:hypothetical protein
VKKPAPRKRLKGYDDGGYVGPMPSSDSIGKGIMSGASMALGAYGAYQRGKALDAASQIKGTSDDKLPMYARGGKIKKVAGKPIGKDDGLIPAQKGEYVVRKSAVNKLGTKALDTINKGRIPKGRR